MTTKTSDSGVPPDYDPSQFPSFAVTVDVVILTMSGGRLHVLLISRGVPPFEGMWAVPGGFKRPDETLDEAAQRELAEETGVDAASLLAQFRAYGDPGRDPRMNVVTVAYLAVLPTVGGVVAGTDAAAAALLPVADVLDGKLELAFDHERIVRDAVERVRIDLEVRGIATAFVGPTFTLAELRAVYEAVWGVELDSANFRRSLLSDGGWVIPTGRRAQPGSVGGQAGGALPGRADVEARRADPAAGAERDAKGTDVRAVVYDRYGPPDVLRVEDVERPVPAADEVLVRIHASTVTRTDCGFRSAEVFVSRFFTGLHRPKRKILGLEFAGEVDAVGAAVTEFDVGDRVFGVREGAHAEFVCVRESGALSSMPPGTTFEEAAAVCDGASLALACLRKAGDLEGRSVLVYGASGSVGTAGVQLAKHFGADVTAVCDTKHVELVRSLGADTVIDYTRENFARNGETYDVIFDAVGMQSFRRCRRSLKPGGTFVDTDPGFVWHVPMLALLTRWVGDKRVALGITRYAKQDVVLVKELIEAGEYRAVIDRRYPLDDVVEAHRYVETGQKTGNVVLTVS